MGKIRSVLLFTALSALALTGCAAAATSGSNSAPPPAAPDAATNAAWLDATQIVLDVRVHGCAPVIDGIGVGEQSIDVQLMANPAASCPAEEQRHGILVSVPAGIDTRESVVLNISGPEGDASVTLAGRADGEVVPADRIDTPPAVAWLGGSSFAFLTWGSSSCAPTFGTVEKTGDATATVSLENETKSDMCTADYAPSIVIVDAPDLPADTVFTLDGMTTEAGDPVTVTP